MSSENYTVLNYIGPPYTEEGKLTPNYYYHVQALDNPNRPIAAAIQKMLEGWEEYMQTVLLPNQEDSEGDPDRILGLSWAQLGLSILELLNGETQGLDCASIHSNVCYLIRQYGFKTDGFTILD